VSSRLLLDSSLSSGLICVSIMCPNNNAARVRTFKGAFKGMVPRFQKRRLLYAVIGAERC
jgi:hypothetical protein